MNDAINVRYRRIISAVQRYILSDKIMARRYVGKASLGDELYVHIIREAFTRRHTGKKGTGCRTG